MSLRRAFLAALLTLCGGPSAFAADPGKDTILVVPMFGDGVSVRIPAGWTKGHQQKTERQAIMEFVPAGQSVASWSEMITVQAYAGMPADLDPLRFLESVAVRMGEVCPGQRVAITLGDRRVGERPAHAAIIGCGSLPAATAGAKAGQGEVAVYLAIRGPHDFVVVQRAVRGKAFERTQPPISAPVAEAMLKALEPLAVCGLSDKLAKCGGDAKR